MDVVKLENIKDKLLSIREEAVLLDSDVAEIYGVETKRINEAVKNNLDKFLMDICWNLQKKSLQICGRKFRPQN